MVVMAGEVSNNVASAADDEFSSAVRVDEGTEAVGQSATIADARDDGEGAAPGDP